MRLLEILQEYDFDIECCPGARKCIRDVLLCHVLESHRDADLGYRPGDLRPGQATAELQQTGHLKDSEDVGGREFLIPWGEDTAEQKEYFEMNEEN